MGVAIDSADQKPKSASPDAAILEAADRAVRLARLLERAVRYSSQFLSSLRTFLKAIDRSVWMHTTPEAYAAIQTYTADSLREAGFDDAIDRVFAQIAGVMVEIRRSPGERRAGESPTLSAVLGELAALEGRLAPATENGGGGPTPPPGERSNSAG